MFMKGICLLLAIGLVALSIGCQSACPAARPLSAGEQAERAAADAEASRYHCQKCACKKFTIHNPKALRTELCINCGHDADAHNIPK